MKDYRTWWRIIQEEIDSLKIPWFEQPYPDDFDDWDCLYEQLWAEREGLA